MSMSRSEMDLGLAVANFDSVKISFEGDEEEGRAVKQSGQRLIKSKSLMKGPISEDGAEVIEMERSRSEQLESTL